MKCWECEIEGAPLHNHHPVPRSRGGTKTILLCEPCHSKAHHRKKNMNTSKLTKEGLARAKARGVKLGNPNIDKAAKRSREVRSGLADQFAWDLKSLVDACRKVGIDTQQGIANHLNELQKPTRRGGKWSSEGVRRLLIRIDRLTEVNNKK